MMQQNFNYRIAVIKLTSYNTNHYKGLALRKAEDSLKENVFKKPNNKNSNKFDHLFKG